MPTDPRDSAGKHAAIEAKLTLSFADAYTAWKAGGHGAGAGNSTHWKGDVVEGQCRANAAAVTAACVMAMFGGCGK
ncbi:hypothetical protein C8J57DRAFT_1518595 [Mycena rebaudengoi]|nr:hypothetical protein C8J57DRAFT_1518595 [Mycena rebaudengoi]